MTKTELKDELDETFVRRQWVVQRAGWVVMAVIIALALLGIFGTSPLASTIDARDANGAHYEVEHARFTRYQLVDRMHIRVDAPAATGEELKLAFSNEWIENNAVRATTPEADGGGTDATGGTYTFQVDDWSQRVVVAVEFEARKAFRSEGALTITAGDLPPVELSISSWVHP